MTDQRVGGSSYSSVSSIGEFGGKSSVSSAVKKKKRQRRLSTVEWKFLPNVPLPRPAAEKHVGQNLEAYDGGKHNGCLHNRVAVQAPGTCADSSAQETVAHNDEYDGNNSNDGTNIEEKESAKLLLTKDQLGTLSELEKLIEQAVQDKMRRDEELASEASLSEDEEEEEAGASTGLLGLGKTAKQKAAGTAIARLLSGGTDTGGQNSDSNVDAEEDLKRRQRVLGLVQENEDSSDVVNFNKKINSGPPVFVVPFVNRLQLAERVPDSLFSSDEQAQEQREFEARNNKALNLLRFASGKEAGSKYGTTWYMRPQDWGAEAQLLRQEKEEEAMNEARKTKEDAESEKTGDGDATAQARRGNEGVPESEASPRPGTPGKPRPPPGGNNANAPVPGGRAAMAARSKTAKLDLEAQQREALQDLYISKQYKAFVLASGQSLPGYLRKSGTIDLLHS